MNDKYSDRNKSNNGETSMNKLKSIKYLCPAIAVLSFIYLLGVAGGLENGTMTFGTAIVNGIIAGTIFGASVWASSKL